MKNAKTIIVNFIYYILLVISLLIWVIGCLFEIVSPVKIDEIFSKIGISNGIGFYNVIGIIVLILFAITHIIKFKWLGK